MGPDAGSFARPGATEGASHATPDAPLIFGVVHTQLPLDLWPEANKIERGETNFANLTSDLTHSLAFSRNRSKLSLLHHNKLHKTQHMTNKLTTKNASSAYAVARASKSANRRVATIASHITSSPSSQTASDVAEGLKSKVIGFTQGDLEETDKMYNTHNHTLLTALHEGKGDVFTLMRDGVPVVFVRDPKGVKQARRLLRPLLRTTAASTRVVSNGVD